MKKAILMMALVSMFFIVFLGADHLSKDEMWKLRVMGKNPNYFEF